MMKIVTRIALTMGVAPAAGCSHAAEPPAEAIVTPLEGGLTWVGDTHLRYDGKWIPPHLVMSERALDVYTQTYPRGSTRQVELFWKDGAATVHSAPMLVDLDGAGPSGSNTQWRATIPAAFMKAGAATEYWIRAEGADGRVLWESADGRNHRVAPHGEIALWSGRPEDRVLWRHAGRGRFEVEGGALVATPGDALGLFWCTVPTPASFELALEFRLADANDNSGVFVRFRDPESFGYDNAAWAAVHDGLEVQIDETARPDGADVHRTGAFYELPGQMLSLRAARPPGQWNEYVIRARGAELSVDLNGERVATVTFAGDASRPLRGLASAPGAPRFIGLQSHTGRVSFRNVRLRHAPP